MLWALGIVEVGLMGLLWHCFTGNRARAFRLESRFDRDSSQPKSHLELAPYWSRFKKIALVPMALAVAKPKKLKGRDAEIFDFWAKEGAKYPNRKFEVNNKLIIGCPFNNLNGIRLDPDSSADKNKPRFIFTYPDAPEGFKKVFFTFTELAAPIGDKAIVLLGTLALFSIYFLFLVRIYPMLA
jgi:hypothetical protein